jgi:hypothetical protein
MVQNCDNEIFGRLGGRQSPPNPNSILSQLKGLAVIILFPSKPTIEVKCSLIDEYVKKAIAHGTSTFNGSSVLGPCYLALFHSTNFTISHNHPYFFSSYHLYLLSF